MFGLGMPELIIISSILCIWLSIFLRKRYPGKVWLGLVLTFFSPLFGQLYVERSGKWIGIMVIYFGLLGWLTGYSNAAIWIGVLLSIAIMYYRLAKLKKEEQTKSMANIES